jgi:hypothetical protein
MSRTNKSLSALAVAAIVLVIATWFDVSIMSDVRRHAAAAFDISGVTTTDGGLGPSPESLGFVLLVATGVEAASARLSASAYIVVGGLLVALPPRVDLRDPVKTMRPVLPGAALGVGHREHLLLELYRR